MSKQTGLEARYVVEKVSNQKKVVDCIVLEFDDPIARVGIRAWADAMAEAGYKKCSDEIIKKLKRTGKRM